MFTNNYAVVFIVLPWSTLSSIHTWYNTCLAKFIDTIKALDVVISNGDGLNNSSV